MTLRDLQVVRPAIATVLAVTAMSVLTSVTATVSSAASGSNSGEVFPPTVMAPPLNVAVPTASLRVVGNRGVPVTPTQKQKRFLRRAGGNDLHLLATREGIGVYSYRVGGQTCFAVEVAAAPAFHTVATLNGDCPAAFPAAQSVDDFSSYSSHCPVHLPSLFSVVGVASNGVATVTLLDSDSRVVGEMKVVKNVYIAGTNSPFLFSRRAVQIVARDSAGTIVYRDLGAPFACAPGAVPSPDVPGKNAI